MVLFLGWQGDPCKDEKYFFTQMCADRPTAENAHSWATVLADLTGLGYNFDVCTQIGNCHVDDARNQLAAKFLASDCTHLVFIDSDIMFDSRAIIQLLECPEELCGATYPFKDGSGDFPITFDRLSFADERGYVECDGLPTGFMKISRKVFEELEEHVDHYFAKTLPGTPIGEYFKRETDNGVRIGGDISFCRLWRRHGGRVWLVPKVMLGHTGSRTAEGQFWFKHAQRDLGVWPAIREMIEDDQWNNHQVLEAALVQWGSNHTSHQLVATVMEVVKGCPPGEILEMGSGLTTVFLSTTGRKITSLEQDRAYLGKTWGVIDDFGPTYLANVNLIHAPTVDNVYQAPKEVWEKKYAFALVDGPKIAKEGDGRPDWARIDADVIMVDDCERKYSQDIIKGLEEKGYTTTMLPIPGKYIVVAKR